MLKTQLLIVVKYLWQISCTHTQNEILRDLTNDSHKVIKFLAQMVETWATDIAFRSFSTIRNCHFFSFIILFINIVFSWIYRFSLGYIPPIPRIRKPRIPRENFNTFLCAKYIFKDGLSTKLLQNTLKLINKFLQFNHLETKSEDNWGNNLHKSKFVHKMKTTDKQNCK